MQLCSLHRPLRRASAPKSQTRTQTQTHQHLSRGRRGGGGNPRIVSATHCLQISCFLLRRSNRSCCHHPILQHPHHHRPHHYRSQMGHLPMLSILISHFIGVDVRPLRPNRKAFTTSQKSFPKRFEKAILRIPPHENLVPMIHQHHQWLLRYSLGFESDPVVQDKLHSVVPMLDEL